MESSDPARMRVSFVCVACSVRCHKLNTSLELIIAAAKALIEDTVIGMIPREVARWLSGGPRLISALSGLGPAKLRV